MCTTIKKDEDDEEHKEAYFKSITPAPGILQACHDSRVQALKHYTTKAFQVKNRKGGELEESVYINRDLDILRINIPFKDVHRYVQWDFEDRVEGWRAGRREKNQYNNIDHRLVGYKYGVMCGKVGGMSFVLEKRVTVLLHWLVIFILERDQANEIDTGWYTDVWKKATVLG